MGKFILTLVVVVFLFNSCGNQGKKAETENAKEVKLVSESEGVKYERIDASSHIEWRASHLGGLEKRFGKVYLKNAEVVVSNNTLSNATVLVDMSSLTVENFDDEESKSKLTGHLKSGDFFDVEKYPTAKFELTGIEPSNGEFNSTVTGNLTILEVTKSIKFNAEVAVTDSYVQLKSEDFSVDRTDWKLSYNVEGTEGVPVDYLIANDIGFTINVKVSK